MLRSTLEGAEMGSRQRMLVLGVESQYDSL